MKNFGYLIIIILIVAIIYAYKKKQQKDHEDSILTSSNMPSASGKTPKMPPNGVVWPPANSI